MSTTVDLRKLDLLIDRLPDRVTYFVVANADYSIYQEFGTRFTGARPFMGPALLNNRDTLAEAIKLHGIRRLDRAVREAAFIVQSDAQAFAPFLTGFLRNNIVVTKEQP